MTTEELWALHANANQSQKYPLGRALVNEWETLSIITIRYLRELNAWFEANHTRMSSPPPRDPADVKQADEVAYQAAIKKGWADG